MLIEGAKVLPKGKRVQWVGTTTHWLFRKDQWATVLDSRLTCNRTLKIQFDGDTIRCMRISQV